MIALMMVVALYIAQAQADIVTLKASVDAVPMATNYKTLLKNVLTSASQRLTQSETNYANGVSYDQQSADAYAAGDPVEGARLHDLALQSYAGSVAAANAAKSLLNTFKAYVNQVPGFVPFGYRQNLTDQANYIISEI